jgi:hypothetical protein
MRCAIAMLLLISLNILTGAHAAGRSIKYEDDFVTFEYPAGRYSRIERSIFDFTVTAKTKDGFMYDMIFRSMDNADSVIVCPHSLRVCASNTSGLQRYWFDDDDFHFLNPTAGPTLVRTSIPGEVAYEVEDLCGTGGPGRCYAAVKSSNNQTISIVYWIGDAPVSARKIAKAKRAAWKILDSVKIRKIPADN